MSDKKQTKEQIAIAAYETFMGMMAMLQTRLDLGATRNYISIMMDGLVAPFDRMEMTFVRPGGKSPRETARDMRGIAVSCLDMIEQLAKGKITLENPDSLLEFVKQSRYKLSPLREDDE